MMSPQKRLNEKTKDTELFIKESNNILNKLDLPDFAKKIQEDSLKKRLSNLKEEDEVTKRVSEFEEVILTLHSNNLPPGQISVRSLSLILGGFQNLSDSIANTLFNQPSEKGKIPQEILDYNELIFKESRPGSFKAILELKHSVPNLVDDEPVQFQTLSELFNLFHSSDEEEILSESISFLGPRALKNYAEWTKTIRDMDTTVDVEWASSFIGTSKVSVNPEKARNIYRILSDYSETKEEEITLAGKLMGANVRTKTFEINTNEGEKITGRISKDALPAVASFILDKECKAVLLKVTTKSSSKEKITWTLKSILEVE